ncbi:MAG TPA: RNA polymerase sigma factor [Anaerolineaceae bacterium]|nr:RNA polymerase sigma factor [Anaerolineaceae bacterium]
MTAMLIADPEKTRSSPDPGDDIHLAQLARSDGRAFSQLYQRHYSRVYSYLLLRTGNVDDAQDLTSQTFIAALEGITRFRGEGSFAAWLLGIAHNKMATHFRHLRPQADLELVDRLKPPGPPLEELVDLHSRLDRVAAALQQIHLDRAEALILRIFTGLSNAETAAVLGRTEAATKMLVYRALQDLRGRLDANGEQS